MTTEHIARDIVENCAFGLIALGYSWLRRVIKERTTGKRVGVVHVSCASAADMPQTIAAPREATRHAVIEMLNCLLFGG